VEGKGRERGGRARDWERRVKALRAAACALLNKFCTSCIHSSIGIAYNARDALLIIDSFGACAA